MTPDDSAALDRQLAEMIRRWHRLRWAAVTVLALIVVAAIVVGALFLARDQERLAASCAWYRDIGRASITLNPATGKPSQLGISLIVDARVAYRGQGCGEPGAADPSLARWAAYYHLPRP